MAERLADDYAEIAQRMRELAAERGDMQTATEPAPEGQYCPVCSGAGYVPTTRTTSGWTLCEQCDNVHRMPRPKARR
jgi:hypothetical protein